jgi:hypothetical protein
MRMFVNVTFKCTFLKLKQCVQMYTNVTKC